MASLFSHTLGLSTDPRNFYARAAVKPRGPDALLLTNRLAYWLVALLVVAVAVVACYVCLD